jgi:hypothetical protein
MSIVVLQLPDVKRKSENRPRECRYCHGETFQRWGLGEEAGQGQPLSQG